MTVDNGPLIDDLPLKWRWTFHIYVTNHLRVSGFDIELSSYIEFLHNVIPWLYMVIYYNIVYPYMIVYSGSPSKWYIICMKIGVEYYIIYITTIYYIAPYSFIKYHHLCQIHMFKRCSLQDAFGAAAPACMWVAVFGCLAGWAILHSKLLSYQRVYQLYQL